MTLPKLPDITMDDIQKRGMAVLCVVLMCLSGWLLVSKDKAGSRELEAANKGKTECEERYQRLLTQLLVYADIVQETRAERDSIKTVDEVEINKILQ